MNINISLQQLRFIIEVVECGSINAASQNLYISQPDRANFAEIFVVEKKKFADWIKAHQTLQFCKNIKKNAERFSN